MKNKLDRIKMTSRQKPREEDLRGPYFRDQTAIIHASAFRRLKHKTQVFFAPENDHICTRIEHVLHVATVAATICRGLNEEDEDWNLDAELAYAAGLGHDLGHAPFGHFGEKSLTLAMKEPDKPSEPFYHEPHSLRVVDHLANNGRGLNLTYAARDAILCHNGERFEQYLEPDHGFVDLEEKAHDKARVPATWEGCIVRFADKIAYLGRDIEDALLAKFIVIEDVPKRIRDALGETNGKIINALILDLIDNTKRMGKVGLSDDKHSLITELRDFNYKRIYDHDRLVTYQGYCKAIITSLCEYLLTYGQAIIHGEKKHPIIDDRFQKYVQSIPKQYDKEGGLRLAVRDYVAGMSDNYALTCFKELTLPKPIEFN